MCRRPPRTPPHDTLFPYPTLFRSIAGQPPPRAPSSRKTTATCVSGITRPSDRSNATHASRWHRSTGSPYAPDRSSLRGFTPADRSEEHTSELQSLMRISYAVCCCKKKKTKKRKQTTHTRQRI